MPCSSVPTTRKARLLALPLRTAVGCALLVLSSAPSPADAAAKGPEARVLERALKLLPHLLHIPVRYIDPELAPDPDAIRRVDAFLVRELDGTIRQVIYLNRKSSLVEKALVGKDIDIAILAAVIRHEVEHLRGGGEPEARNAEREFFQHLMFVGHVPLNDGLAYLADLEQHHHLRETR